MSLNRAAGKGRAVVMKVIAGDPQWATALPMRYDRFSLTLTAHAMAANQLPLYKERRRFRY